MSRQISREEVKHHADRRSSWIIIRNEVYDVTTFLNEHPGGADILLDHAGKDATIAFEEVSHSDNARQLMRKYKIGTVSQHGPNCCCGHRHVTPDLQSGFVPCPNNIIVLPVTSNECCTPDPRRVPKKTWRTFDGTKSTRIEGTTSIEGQSTAIDGPRSVGAQSSDGPFTPSGPRSAGGAYSVGGPQTAIGPQTAGGPRSTGGSQAPHSPGFRGHKSKDGLRPAGGHGTPAQKGHAPVGATKGPCQHCTQDPSQLRGARPEEHVKSIIVPRESGGGGKLKWAIIVLASALVVAIAIKKMKG